MLRFLTVADALSILNACFGLLSVFAVFSGEFVWGFVFILLALLADGLDGVVARRLGGGRVGEYLEAMADMTSLAIAPLVLLYGVYTGIGLQPWFFIVLLASMLFFLVCSTVRLSAFHLLKEERVFLGLPASGSAIILISIGMLRFDALSIPVILVVLGVMKISMIPFPKLGGRLTVIASIVIFSAMVLALLHSSYGPVLLLVMICLYVGIGPFLARSKATGIP